MEPEEYRMDDPYLFFRVCTADGDLVCSGFTTVSCGLQFHRTAGEDQEGTVETKTRSRPPHEAARTGAATTTTTTTTGPTTSTAVECGD